MHDCLPSLWETSGQMVEIRIAVRKRFYLRGMLNGKDRGL